MATKKLKTYGVSFKLTIEIGFNISAENMKEAVEKAEAMKVCDIIDFQKNGWDHNDSDVPQLKAIYVNE